MTDKEILDWIHKSSPSIEQQLRRWLDEILKNGHNSSEYFHGVELHDGGRLALLRPYTNKYNGFCLSICTVRLPAEIQRKGWFKSFLKLCCEMNPWRDVILEDVGNEHLKSFCERNKFHVLDPFYKTTYVVNKQVVMNLVTSPLGRYTDYLTLSKSV
ncbi:hypothetical protein [Enterobacter quasiroggenkampii]|uniref:hypothetical protein n=1 Tax=Enterobacter quasiroggenkampii TaxID=2497436 RepID=UPI0039C10F23